MEVVLLSNLPWDHPGQTNRQAWVHGLLAYAPAARVVYAETLGWRRRAVVRAERLPGTEAEVTIVGLPNPMPFAGRAWNVLARRVNRFFWTRTLRSVMAAQAPEVVVIFDPLAATAVSGLRAGLTIYDCLDHYEEQPQFEGTLSRKTLLHEEKKLVDVVDRIAVSSSGLAARPNFEGRTVVVAPGVVSAPTWAPVEPAPTRGSGPSAVYVGALDGYKVELQLLSALSQIAPLKIVGRTEFADAKVSGFLADIENRARVAMLGSVPRDRLGSILAEATFGVVAMTKSRYSEGSFPLKYWDYLHAGLPVLALNCDALRGLPGVVTIDAVGDLDESVVARLGELGHRRNELQSYAAGYGPKERVACILG